MNKETLLDLIRHFIVFEKSKTEDPKTGVVTIKTVKKLAAYHQYYAVNRAKTPSTVTYHCLGYARLHHLCDRL
jgi:type I site-specific restriction-modification system R (restriction) subunit